MRCERLRSTAIVVAATLISLMPEAAPIAQTEPSRPRVSLTQLVQQFELWPADVNGDGITDLVSSLAGVQTVVQIGAGDGTFSSMREVADERVPVGVGDINGDGFIDILMKAVGTTLAGSVSLGRGDGTFAEATDLGIAMGHPTYVVDVNNDGRADIITTNTTDPLQPPLSGRALVYQGHGNLAFALATVLPLSASTDILFGIAVTDITGDGRVDVALHGNLGRRIDLYANQGSFSFAHTVIPLDWPGGGLAARDLNGDGIVDLVAGMGRWNTSFWLDGFVYVLLGTGGGSFAPPVRYPTPNGPISVVIGDFNGDGIPDIATGNQSAIERCEGETHLWDSVSILPGRGDGTFAATASFALGDSENEPDRQYRRSVARVNTSDLDADGRTDLLVSRGAILLSLPAGENRPPVPNAGPDRVEPPNMIGFERLPGSATDPDHDWLTYAWTDDLGQTVGTLPNQCFSANYGQTTRTFTLSATDGLGASGHDSMQWTFIGPTPPPTPIPPAFSGQDIGDVQVSGWEGIDNGVFRVAADGADIWGTSDAFRFVHTPVTGNFDVVTRVDSVEQIDQWTKAGLMVRETLTANARHASIFATPSAVKGVAFQRREFEGGVSTHTAGPLAPPPVWLRLQRAGDVVSAYTRPDESEPWSLIGTQTLAGLASSVHVGMAVTSHRQGVLATAFFSSFAIDAADPPGPALPSGWQSSDVGAVAFPGSAAFDGSTFTVRASGADIWGTSDQFQFVYRTLTGDGTIIARVTSLQQTHVWAKAGVMMRASLSPDSPHASMFVTPAGTNGLAYQRRIEAGGISTHTSGGADDPPAWIALWRNGDIIHAFRSDDGHNWIWIGADVFPMPATIYVGLAVTSHESGAVTTATFDGVAVAP